MASAMVAVENCMVKVLVKKVVIELVALKVNQEVVWKLRSDCVVMSISSWRCSSLYTPSCPPQSRDLAVSDFQYHHCITV
jgi:hypothetical protein